MLWYGGLSYAMPDNNGAEDFPSIRAALDACRDREENRDGRTPCVEYVWGDYCGYLYFGEIGDYPDRVIERGKRGGYRAVRC